MSIYVGRKKVGGLYKGDKQVLQVYKGSDLIYQNTEAVYAFKFTIDTTLGPNGTSSASNTKVMAFATNNVSGNPTAYGGLVIDWGDGTSETKSGGSATHTHTYSKHGVYQIKIMPVLVNNVPRADGWLSGFAIANQNYGSKIKSIDTPFPRRGIIVSTGSAQGHPIYTNTLSQLLRYTRNIESVPDNLLSGIVIDIDKTVPTPTLQNLFNCSFTEMAYNMKGLDVDGFFAQFKSLLDSIDTSGVKNLSQMFAYTFYQYAYNSTNGTIPAGLFDSIDTTNATSLSSMFAYTFSAYAYNSTNGTIPAGLFDSIDTTNATSLSQMFAYTFYQYAYNSTNGTIPAGLFDSIDTTNATDLSSMFYQTFCQYAYNSTFTIPSGLFKKIVPSAGVTDANKSSMFSYTFADQDSTTPTGNVTISDVFDGMTDFSWATASNAYSIFRMMFGKTNGADRTMLGNASDILQHFNFTPTQRTQMFCLREGLSDYASIGTNWK